MNRALTLIACGDVFEPDPEGDATKSSSQVLIPLGQPCDISLRSRKPSGHLDTAFLVPLKKRLPTKRAHPKMPLLPFKLRGEYWACDFRNVTMARFSILDIASLRPDGRVRVEDGHKPPDELLEGQKIYEDRAAAVTTTMVDGSFPPTDEEIAVELLLTFSSPDRFKNIYIPILEKETTRKDHETVIKKPKRTTWRLRHRGRVRLPNVAGLLEEYASLMSRHAFDIDFP